VETPVFVSLTEARRTTKINRKWPKGQDDHKVTNFLINEVKAKTSGESSPMSSQVIPLHYVTVEFRLRDQNRIIEKSGQHRFLYGVEHWIDGLDQQLENLREGDHLKLKLDSHTAALVASRLLSREEWPELERGLALELKVVEVVKAEPKEVVKALAATVQCCDHCGGH
jgi:hypothetical protein